MKISVVIPTHNRLEQLKKVLVGLAKQTFPAAQFEVLVISDGSTDGTDAFLQTASLHLNMRPLFQSNQGPAAARNLGIAQSSGNITLFLDDDVFPLRELIEEHLRFHEIHGDRAVVIGPMLTPPDYNPSPWVRWAMEKVEEQYHEMVTSKWTPTARQFYTGKTSIPISTGLVMWWFGIIAE